MLYKLVCLIALALAGNACSDEFQMISDDIPDMEDPSENCDDVASIDSTRPSCTETLIWDNVVSITVDGDLRVIQSNGIPDHDIGLFGQVAGALNPNAVSVQNAVYEIPAHPSKSAQPTSLLSVTTGPRYSFGVMLNGVELDPEAAEPWPHIRGNFNNVNWEWNLDAMSINLGLDCNNAHVQPTGKYHYHGASALFQEELTTLANTMTLAGYAADGFPIYYRYGYTGQNTTSPVKELVSSYRLKSGERPGDGTSAPCGPYSGIYTADYEYVAGLGDLDECNGREGVTPEYPDGTYYYVITGTYPYIGRCLVGTPSSSFSIR